MWHCRELAADTVVGGKLVEGSVSSSCLADGTINKCWSRRLAGPEWQEGTSQQEDSSPVSDKTLSYSSFILFKF